MSVIRQGIRWLLVPVSAAAVVVLCIVGARWAIRIVDQRCPMESMVGGACVEPWHTSAVESAIYVAVALGAFGLVLLPALTAPHLKRPLAVVMLAVTLVAGGAGYFYMGWADMLMPFIVAALAGAAALWLVWSRRSVDAV